MRLIADFHIHTVASGHAYSTALEYASVAAKKGIQVIAITDHGPAMPGGPHYYHFSNLRMLPKQIEGVSVLKGVEANIINENGDIDLEERELKLLDIVMVAMHPRCGYEDLGEKGNTEVMLKAMDNPYINIIAHPGNPMFCVDPKKIVEKAKAKGILLEINNSSFTGSRAGSEDRCLEIAREVKRQGWKVVIGSDAHYAEMVGTFEKAIELAGRAGLAEKDVVNSSLELIEEFIIRRERNA